MHQRTALVLAGKLWKGHKQRFVWWATSIEISSALARIERENKITNQQRLNAENRLKMLEKVWFEILPNLRIKELAKTFPTQFNMKAADSLQLASALVWCNEKPKGKIFISGDGHLIKIAQNIGFTTELL